MKLYQKIPHRKTNLTKQMELNYELGWWRTGRNNAKRLKNGAATKPPIELVPNQFIRLRKNLKLYQKIPWRIRNLKKKWCSIPSLNEGEQAKTMQSASKPRLPQSHPIILKWRPPSQTKLMTLGGNDDWGHPLIHNQVPLTSSLIQASKMGSP